MFKTIATGNIMIHKTILYFHCHLEHFHRLIIIVTIVKNILHWDPKLHHWHHYITICVHNLIISVPICLEGRSKAAPRRQDRLTRVAAFRILDSRWSTPNPSLLIGRGLSAASWFVETLNGRLSDNRLELNWLIYSQSTIQYYTQHSRGRGGPGA